MYLSVKSKKRLTIDLINKFSILNGAKYFFSGIFQNYIEFIPAKKCIKYLNGTTQIDSWKSNRISEENIENIMKSDSNFALTFVDHHVLPDSLIKNKVSIPKKVINLHTSYKLNPQLRNLNTDFTLNNYLFGSVKLTKNDDLDKYKHISYGIGFSVAFNPIDTNDIPDIQNYLMKKT